MQCYYYYYYKLCTVNIEKHKNSEQKVTLAQANPGNKRLQAALKNKKKLKTDNDNVKS